MRTDLNFEQADDADLLNALKDESTLSRQEVLVIAYKENSELVLSCAKELYSQELVTVFDLSDANFSDRLPELLPRLIRDSKEFCSDVLTRCLGDCLTMLARQGKFDSRTALLEELSSIQNEQRAELEIWSALKAGIFTPAEIDLLLSFRFKSPDIQKLQKTAKLYHPELKNEAALDLLDRGSDARELFTLFNTFSTPVQARIYREFGKIVRDSSRWYVDDIAAILSSEFFQEADLCAILEHASYPHQDILRIVKPEIMGSLACDLVIQKAKDEDTFKESAAIILSRSTSLDPARKKKLLRISMSGTDGLLALSDLGFEMTDEEFAKGVLKLAEYDECVCVESFESILSKLSISGRTGVFKILAKKCTLPLLAGALLATPVCPAAEHARLLDLYLSSKPNNWKIRSFLSSERKITLSQELADRLLRYALETCDSSDSYRLLNSIEGASKSLILELTEGCCKSVESSLALLNDLESIPESIRPRLEKKLITKVLSSAEGYVNILNLPSIVLTDDQWEKLVRKFCEKESYRSSGALEKIMGRAPTHAKLILMKSSMRKSSESALSNPDHLNFVAENMDDESISEILSTCLDRWRFEAFDKLVSSLKCERLVQAVLADKIKDKSELLGTLITHWTGTGNKRMIGLLGSSGSLSSSVVVKLSLLNPGEALGRQLEREVLELGDDEGVLKVIMKASNYEGYSASFLRKLMSGPLHLVRMYADRTHSDNSSIFEKLTAHSEGASILESLMDPDDEKCAKIIVKHLSLTDGMPCSYVERAVDTILKTETLEQAMELCYTPVYSGVHSDKLIRKIVDAAMKMEPESALRLIFDSDKLKGALSKAELGRLVAQATENGATTNHRFEIGELVDFDDETAKKIIDKDLVRLYYGGSHEAGAFIAKSSEEISTHLLRKILSDDDARTSSNTFFNTVNAALKAKPSLEGVLCEIMRPKLSNPNAISACYLAGLQREAIDALKGFDLEAQFSFINTVDFKSKPHPRFAAEFAFDAFMRNSKGRGRITEVDGQISADFHFFKIKTGTSSNMIVFGQAPSCTDEMIEVGKKAVAELTALPAQVEGTLDLKSKSFVASDGSMVIGLTDFYTIEEEDLIATLDRFQADFKIRAVAKRVGALYSLFPDFSAAEWGIKKPIRKKKKMVQNLLDLKRNDLESHFNDLLKMSATRAFGLEVEMASEIDRDAITSHLMHNVEIEGFKAVAIDEYKKSSGRGGWEIKYDCSVEGGTSAELVSPKLYGDEGIAEVETVLNTLLTLNEDKDTLHVGEEYCTGMHVHHDVSDLKKRDVAVDELAEVLVRIQEPLYRLCSPDRQQNDYCQRIGVGSEGSLTVPHRGGFNCFVKHLNSRGGTSGYTLEFRMRESILDPGGVGRWIKLTQQVVEGLAEQSKGKIKKHHDILMNVIEAAEAERAMQLQETSEIESGEKQRRFNSFSEICDMARWMSEQPN